MILCILYLRGLCAYLCVCVRASMRAYVGVPLTPFCKSISRRFFFFFKKVDVKSLRVQVDCNFFKGEKQTFPLSQHTNTHNELKG